MTYHDLLYIDASSITQACTFIFHWSYPIISHRNPSAHMAHRASRIRNNQSWCRMSDVSEMSSLNKKTAWEWFWPSTSRIFEDKNDKNMPRTDILIHGWCYIVIIPIIKLDEIEEYNPISSSIHWSLVYSSVLCVHQFSELIYVNPWEKGMLPLIRILSFQWCRDMRFAPSFMKISHDISWHTTIFVG